MRRTSLLIAAFAAVALVLAPGMAFARAGSTSSSPGSSMGSRGSRTFSAPAPTQSAPMGAAPVQRSMTTPPAPAYGTPSPAVGGYGAGASRSPFMSGLMGGLIGAGIGGLLFGGGLFHGISGFGGFLGFLLQIFLLVLLARFLIRRFMRRSQPAFAGPTVMARGAPPARPSPGGGPAGPAVAIGPEDYEQFERLLQGVQAAWSRHDLATLQTLTTPEMTSYFAEQLAEQVSRGVRNSVTEVRLEQGNLSEAWSERGHEYATVSMRFSMVDVTRDAAGNVVDGHPTEHVDATEFWTFLRSPGGRWVLSAIQQVR